MMDGSGQFPLHLAVKTAHTEVFKLLLAHDPALLGRENAMGQTPAELAWSMLIQDAVKDGNPDIRGYSHRFLEHKTAEQFAEGRDDDTMDDGGPRASEKSEIEKIWAIIKDVMEKEPRARERKLVSVNEAREVARRLAERRKRDLNDLEKAHEEEDLKKKGKEPETDEVQAWLGFNTLSIE
ncbi:MAG: hypothetical protein Q9218_007867 [Villophora microphyllina]